MGYRRVEYIRNNFTWFNTNININNNIKLELDFEIASINSNTNNCVMGNWQDGYSSSTALIFNAHKGGYFRCYVGGYYNDYVLAYTIGHRYVNTIDRNAFVIDDLTSATSYTQTIGRTITSSSNPIYIGNGNSTGDEPSDIIIYEAIVYDGEDIVGHYLPYQDTQTGYGVLYDTISNTYLNADNPSVVTCGDPLFGPDIEELTFDYSGGTQSIELTSENPWTATTNEWITLSQSTGETGGVITVTVADNIFSQKIGSITFTDGENTATLTVIQNADTRIILKNLYRNGNKVKQLFKNGEKLYQMFERFIFEVDADSFTFDYEGNTLTLTITASDPWTMTKPEWITASSVSGLGNTTVTLTVPQNPTEDSRDGNIVLTSEGRSITIPVEQNGSFGLGTPLTFEITGDGYINWYAYNDSYRKTIEYKLNNDEWTSITSTHSGVHINVVSGDTVQFRGDNTSYSPGAQNRFNCFSACTCQFIVKGNIMSLVNSTNFKDLEILSDSYTFRSLFQGCTGLTSTENMFLPATTLSQGCYRSMFDTCSHLTIAPVLPATTLTGECYNNMFLRCTSLNYIKCLATTNINYNNSTTNWLYNASSSGTFVKKTGINWPSGLSGIPSGWTIQEVDE